MEFDLSAKEDTKMKIGSTNGNNVGSGIIQIPMQQENDSFSKNIQDQIANAQKQMQELGEKKEMSAEDKMKKRQEIQKQISDLQNQLRQHQIEQRKQNQQKKASTQNDMYDNKSQTKKSSSGGTGMSSASMQAIISADSSLKQVKVQGGVKTQMEGRAGVLESEIKFDEAMGNDTTKKKEELAEVETKAQNITSSQMDILSDVQKNLGESAKEEQKISKNDKDKAKRNSADGKTDDVKTLPESEDKQGITVDNIDTTSGEKMDGTSKTVITNSSEPVGQNVDVKL